MSNNFENSKTTPAALSVLNCGNNNTWKEDGSDLIEKKLILEIFIAVDIYGNVSTLNRGAPCEDFSKMHSAYLACIREITEFVKRGPSDCPFSDVNR